MNILFSLLICQMPNHRTYHCGSYRGRKFKIIFLKSRLIFDGLRENHVGQTDNVVYFIWLFMGFASSFSLNKQKYESIMIGKILRAETSVLQLSRKRY